MTYTHVIFDFGGVITTSPFEAFNRLEAERGFPQDFIRAVNAQNRDDNAWAQFERAEIDADQFDGLFAQEARAMGHHLPGKLVLECLAGDVRPHMVAAMDQLKVAGFRLGCITNNVPAGEGPGMARGMDKAAAYADAMSRFEHIIESSKVGIRKPDPRIYQMMCEAFDIAPETCVYLDDLGINCKPAAALGMHAIKVTSGEQALHDLGLALAINLS
jgi:putative hydrolase of the HAD superfamily